MTHMIRVGDDALFTEAKIAAVTEGITLQAFAERALRRALPKAGSSDQTPVAAKSAGPLTKTDLAAFLPPGTVVDPRDSQPFKRPLTAKERYLERLRVQEYYRDHPEEAPQ